MMMQNPQFAQMPPQMPMVDPNTASGATKKKKK